MKRALIILVICFVCISFFACGYEADSITTQTSFADANFNNNYWFSGDFWAFDNTLFYMQDGMYNMGVYKSINGSKEKLFEESEFLSDSIKSVIMGDIFVSEGFLYFDIYLNEELWLYRYDLAENIYAPVTEVPRVYRWTIVGEYFIYTEHPTNNPDNQSSLWIYNLKDGTTVQVCESVEEFGIVGGQLRYITYMDNYTLYQYDYIDKQSSNLGSFSSVFDEKYDIFNFTADAVVMLNWTGECKRNLVVYAISSGSSAVYTLPKGIQYMVAYERYAYLVVYDRYSNISEAVPSAYNGIYRIDLENGTYEVVEKKVDSGTEIHVTSDDNTYIIQRKFILFLSRCQVYKFDYLTGNKDELVLF